VAANLDAHHQDRGLGNLQASQDLVGAGADRFHIIIHDREGLDGGARCPGEIARDLDIDWKRSVDAGSQNPRDRLRRGGQVIQHCLIAGDLLEYSELCLMGADLVMDEKAAQTLRPRRRGGQHDERRSLGIRASDGIDQVECAGSVGDGGYPDSTAYAGGSVSRETYGWFVAQCVKRQNAGALDDREQWEGKVARNTEHGTRSMIPQRRQQPPARVPVQSEART
jgi:hypothetical protein